ncbi:MAG: cache domain-containing protein [Syntrophobacteraceae bacterium]
MKLFYTGLIAVFCTVFLLSAIPALAEQTPEELAKESMEALTASASTPATPQRVVEKVEKAAVLLQKEGKAAFPKFQGKDSEFIFGGTYIWVHDAEGSTMLMHPVMPQLVGKSNASIRDTSGKFIFVEMNETAKKKGGGWVDYMWPKPGEKTPSQKLSYVKLVKVDGVECIVGCGIFGVPAEEVTKLLAQ